jgi:predicted amidohydrolase YtcJ
LLAIETAITRQDPWSNAGDTLNLDEAVDLDTMIAAYTINGAYQMKLDDKQGSIEVGKRADFAVLESDPREAAPEALKDVEIWGTIQGGRVFAAENV